MPLFVLPVYTISGNVHSASGAPLASARIEARAGTTVETKSDRGGNFTLRAAAGTYRITTSEPGFASAAVSVRADRDVSLQVELEPLDSPKLRQIGTVTVDGRLAPISGEIPSVAVSRAEFDALGDDRIIDGLKDLPGLTFARPDGGAASAIAAVALRGPD
ncbi:MAG: carboxypeptidase regulatory-like domain-containing protein, partial [Candidatus Eremiobacteraeota bacterium]|nr:carboxypeptidase regulatory-like domain-containing protein [Candidatus Eremiobacteraeota bacterium]